MGRTIVILVARLIFAAVFAMAVSFKFAGMANTAAYIAAAGLPFPLLLAWLAAIFEVGLILAFLTGAYFSDAALLAGAYVVFLAFAFHGPSHWQANQDEFGFFIDHFTFLAGLLFAAVHGPGERLALRKGFVWKDEAASAN
ncbi:MULTISPECIES: DoxX family protein [Phyllobacteriaceae]|jgi:putative oxidoreductase|uniref:DoxX family protein n=1 Tax=Mesorhizobium hungaricum TaxID=1566387 RepID=A0A1C2DJ16_9HYPH|nr:MULTISPECIES: DoxX family protein [Mesorhizobium]MBN9234245.1 DoxX family protein [Mesorhizobium sp.]MDQ0332310.1 putative membrane protein YphA (DoxX/SURF4 family) [Mesorhizobium sp. YL-MeA3-2017]OCX14645.1 hypothetical protein QV13_19570 [Mesorhizobium hungaricum]